MWYFTFIYFEITIFFTVWCDCIMKTENQTTFVQEAKILIDGLNLVAKCFSYFLFWIPSMLLVTLVTFGYLGFRWEFEKTYFGSIPSSLQFLAFASLLFKLCSSSQELANKIKEIKNKILEIQFNTGQVDAVLALLDQFQGFDGHDFFTLNHSLVTGMTANFVTYLVILVQFKQSESGGEERNSIPFCNCTEN